MNRIFLLALAMAGLVNSAFAADLSRKIGPAVFASVPAFGWTGFYIGAHAGYGFGQTDWQWNNTLVPIKIKPDGFVGGLQAGFNYQLNNYLLFGVEGNISLGNMNNANTTVFELPVQTVIDSYQTQIRWAGDVSFRAGLTIDRLLLFAKGGVALGDFRQTNDFSVAGLGSISIKASSSYTQSGYLIGAGLEYALTNNLITKIEYNYFDFGIRSIGRNSTPTSLSNVEFKNTINVIKTGLNYKF